MSYADRLRGTTAATGAAATTTATIATVNSGSSGSSPSLQNSSKGKPVAQKATKKQQQQQQQQQQPVGANTKKGASPALNSSSPPAKPASSSSASGASKGGKTPMTSPKMGPASSAPPPHTHSNNNAATTTSTSHGGNKRDKKHAVDVNTGDTSNANAVAMNPPENRSLPVPRSGNISRAFNPPSHATSTTAPPSTSSHPSHFSSSTKADGDREQQQVQHLTSPLLAPAYRSNNTNNQNNYNHPQHQHQHAHPSEMYHGGGGGNPYQSSRPDARHFASHAHGGMDSAAAASASSQSHAPAGLSPFTYVGPHASQNRSTRLHQAFKALSKEERQRVVENEAAKTDLLQRTVHVRFLPTGMRQCELAALCNECGEYLRVRICGNSADSHNWIYGFIEFSTREAALKMMQRNGMEVFNGPGRPYLRLRCHEAKQPIVDRVFHDADPATGTPCIFGLGNFANRTLKEALDSYFNLKAKEAIQMRSKGSHSSSDQSHRGTSEGLEDDIEEDSAAAAAGTGAAATIAAAAECEQPFRSNYDHSRFNATPPYNPHLHPPLRGMTHAADRSEYEESVEQRPWEKYYRGAGQKQQQQQDAVSVTSSPGLHANDAQRSPATVFTNLSGQNVAELLLQSTALRPGHAADTAAAAPTPSAPTVSAYVPPKPSAEATAPDANLYDMTAFRQNGAVTNLWGWSAEDATHADNAQIMYSDDVPFSFSTNPGAPKSSDSGAGAFFDLSALQPVGEKSRQTVVEAGAGFEDVESTLLQQQRAGLLLGAAENLAANTSDESGLKQKQQQQRQGSDYGKQQWQVKPQSFSSLAVGSSFGEGGVSASQPTSSGYADSSFSSGPSQQEKLQQPASSSKMQSSTADNYGGKKTSKDGKQGDPNAAQLTSTEKADDSELFANMSIDSSTSSRTSSCAPAASAAVEDANAFITGVVGCDEEKEEENTAATMDAHQTRKQTAQSSENAVTEPEDEDGDSDDTFAAMHVAMTVADAVLMEDDDEEDDDCNEDVAPQHYVVEVEEYGNAATRGATEPRSFFTVKGAEPATPSMHGCYAPSVASSHSVSAGIHALTDGRSTSYRGHHIPLSQNSSPYSRYESAPPRRSVGTPASYLASPPQDVPPPPPPPAYEEFEAETFAQVQFTQNQQQQQQQYGASFNAYRSRSGADSSPYFSSAHVPSPSMNPAYTPHMHLPDSVAGGSVGLTSPYGAGFALPPSSWSVSAGGGGTATSTHERTWSRGASSTNQAAYREYAHSNVSPTPSSRNARLPQHHSRGSLDSACESGENEEAYIHYYSGSNNNNNNEYQDGDFHGDAGRQQRLPHSHPRGLNPESPPFTFKPMDNASQQGMMRMSGGEVDERLLHLKFQQSKEERDMRQLLNRAREIFVSGMQLAALKGAAGESDESDTFFQAIGRLKTLLDIIEKSHYISEKPLLDILVASRSVSSNNNNIEEDRVDGGDNASGVRSSESRNSAGHRGVYVLQGEGEMEQLNSELFKDLAERRMQQLHVSTLLAMALLFLSKEDVPSAVRYVSEIFKLAPSARLTPPTPPQSSSSSSHLEAAHVESVPSLMSPPENGNSRKFLQVDFTPSLGHSLSANSFFSSSHPSSEASSSCKHGSDTPLTLAAADPTLPTTTTKLAVASTSLTSCPMLPPSTSSAVAAATHTRTTSTGTSGSSSDDSLSNEHDPVSISTRLIQVVNEMIYERNCMSARQILHTMIACGIAMEDFDSKVSSCVYTLTAERALSTLGERNRVLDAVVGGSMSALDLSEALLTSPKQGSSNRGEDDEKEEAWKSEETPSKRILRLFFQWSALTAEETEAEVSKLPAGVSNRFGVTQPSASITSSNSNTPSLKASSNPFLFHQQHQKHQRTSSEMPEEDDIFWTSLPPLHCVRLFSSAGGTGTTDKTESTAARPKETAAATSSPPTTNQSQGHHGFNNAVNFY